MNKWSVLLISLLVILAAGLMIYPQIFFSANNGRFGIMGNYLRGGYGGYDTIRSDDATYNGRYGMMGGYIYGGYGDYDTMSSDDVKKEMSESLANAKIDEKNNTIRYTGKNINLIMLGGHEEAEMEGSTENGEEFIVGDLVNPTIYIPKEAKVTLKFINQDPEMPHGVILSAAEPPYPYMLMMNGGYVGVTVPVISEAGENEFPLAETTFTANQLGEFYYICQVPGHAAEGMYGKIIFE